MSISISVVVGYIVLFVYASKWIHVHHMERKNVGLSFLSNFIFVTLSLLYQHQRSLARSFLRRTVHKPIPKKPIPI